MNQSNIRKNTMNEIAYINILKIAVSILPDFGMDPIGINL
jgi:hypothetical protein